jgi:hypothetical protein
VPRPASLLSLRATVILLSATTVGLVAAALSFLATWSAPTAVLTGASAAGAAVLLLDTLVEGR